jgi:hypothetical protein
VPGFQEIGKAEKGSQDASSKDFAKTHGNAVATVLISQHRNPHLALWLILQLNRLPLS